LLSEKYLAGFIDADGHLSVRARIGARPDLEFSASQGCEFQEPLLELHKEFGGILRDKGDGHSELCMRGGPARKAFERLKKYLVLKKDQAERFLDLVDRGVVLKDKDAVLAVRQRVKEIRNYGATHEPNYPSRKWMAGYIDGDGSFAVKVCSKTGYAYPSLTILAAPNYHVGLTLLHKAFGGQIQAMGQNAVWVVSLSQPSKIQQVLGHCAPHLLKKKAQAYFLLGCAEKGNLRDGETIRRTIKALNAQQHRLSDSAAEASRLLKEVKFDIQKRQVGRPVGARDTKPRRKRQSNLLV
jgi:hypothetical protein